MRRVNLLPTIHRERVARGNLYPQTVGVLVAVAADPTSPEGAWQYPLSKAQIKRKASEALASATTSMQTYIFFLGPFQGWLENRYANHNQHNNNLQSDK